MAIKFRAVLVFLVFVGTFAVVLRAYQAGDTFPRSAPWAMIVGMSAGVIALTFIMIWGGAYQSAPVPKRLRQWLLGERDQ